MQGFADAAAWIMAAEFPEGIVRDHLASDDPVGPLPGSAFNVAMFWQVGRLGSGRLDGLMRLAGGGKGRPGAGAMIAQLA